MTRVFVYGTLKRGFCNHPYLTGQQFLGEAQNPVMECFQKALEGRSPHRPPSELTDWLSPTAAAETGPPAGNPSENPVIDATCW